MSEELDERPLYTGSVMGKYNIVVLPIGDATFSANLMIYNKEDELLFQKEVPANRNLPDGASQKEYAQWQKTVMDWILNKS